MRYLNFISCSLLQVFLGFMLFQYVACGCVLPEGEFYDGRIIYHSPSDMNKTFEELYILEFECYEGFQLIGMGYVQCVNGNWNHEIPFCARIECSEPPKIPNAVYEVKTGISNHTMLGIYVEYTCNKGYELTDKDVNSLRCTLNTTSKLPEWTGKRPFCNETNKCPDPGAPKFGSRYGECCLSGMSLEFECDEGYELFGEDTIHCLPYGNWSSLRPLCKPFGEHCELPPDIPHGIVGGRKEGDYFVPYEDAIVECEHGYKYDGFEFIFCEEGGIWDSEFRECKEAFCDRPPPLKNGVILELQSTNETIFPYNFELTYVCDKNYRLIGDSWRVCEENGWSGKTPTCTVTKCPDPGNPEDGYRYAKNFTVGSTVSFKCFDSYDLLGSSERECLLNGQWSGELARCNLPTNYCPNPGIPIRGSKNSTNYNLGSKIKFSCPKGYTQLGSRVRECLIDHTWSGIETKCLGKYDFDDEESIRKKIDDLISKRVEEQRINSERFQQLKLLQSQRRGRMLDMNYPGRTILYFMFDVSGSVGRENFKRSIQFAKAIVKKVGISKNGTRAGSLTFSSKVQLNFLPMHYESTQQVLDALDSIAYRGGGTATSSAFTFFRLDMLPLVEQLLGPLNLKHIIFLLTDGRTNMGGSPLTEAKTLKKKGVEIYCFGITGNTLKDSLYSIASKSKDEKYTNVYMFRDYSSLSWLVSVMTRETIDYSKCGLGLENVRKRKKEDSKRKNMEPWPWMAALFMNTGNDIKPIYEFKCGGSVIHRNFILTAAHCLYTEGETESNIIDESSIIIKLGLTDKTNESYVQEFEVQNMFIHTAYNDGDSYDYDIALLQMERPVEYNAYVRPICLPPKNLPDGSKLYRPLSQAWATGWGREVNVSEDDNTFRSTQYLKEIFLPIQSREICSESTRNNNKAISDFTDRMFCAGDGTGMEDTCKGDSGGPIMQSLKSKEGYVYWTQVGIVSWGLECFLEGTYGYYTHLQKLVSWVEETIDYGLRITGV